MGFLNKVFNEAIVSLHLLKYKKERRGRAISKLDLWSLLSRRSSLRGSIEPSEGKDPSGPLRVCRSVVSIGCTTDRSYFALPIGWSDRLHNRSEPHSSVR
ncbi:unnamed protein product [Arabidopsis halleri]